MLLDNYKKESPIVGVAGLGGGINSYIFLSSGGGDYVISKSLRFNSADSSRLSRTFSAGNRKTFTLSFWIKRSGLTSNTGHAILYAGTAGSTTNRTALLIGNAGFSGSGNSILFGQDTSGSWTTYRETSALFRDHSAWAHIVLAVDSTQATASDRIKIYVNGVLQTSFATSNDPSEDHEFFINNNNAHYLGEDVGNFVGNLDAYLADVHFVDGQQLSPTDFGKTDDDGVWQPKKFSGSHGTNGFHLDFKDTSSDAALGYDAAGSNNWDVHNLSVLNGNGNYIAGGTQSGTLYSGRTWNMAFNGSLTGDETIAADSTSCTLTFASGISYSSSVEVYGSLQSGASIQVNGSTVSGFSGSNAWVTALSGTGTFSSITSVSNGVNRGIIVAVRVDNEILIDNSVETNNDSLLDSPSQSVAGETDTGLGGQITGNYATLNPLDRQSTNGTLSNGNLDLTWNTASWVIYRATMHVSSGKWYWEVTLGNNQYSIFGIIPTDYSMSTNSNYWIAQVPGAYCFYPYSGTKYDNTSSSSYASGDTSASGTVYGMALDLDAGTMTYYKNGVSLGTAFTGISGSFSPAAGLYNQSGNDSYNFGQRAFAHAAPTGYKCLTVENLSEPTIADGSKYFDTKIYEGDGVDGRSVSGFKFSPDLIWIKGRETGSNTIQHVLQDTVRGTTSLLSSNESYDPSAFGTHWGYISSFNSDGFSMTAGAGGDDHNNYNGLDYVSWAWDAGDDANPTTIAVGGLNNSLYDQSQTWSGQISGTIYSNTYAKTLVFDGPAPTGAGNPCIPADGYQLTFTPSPAFSNATSVKIYYYYQTAHADAFVLNGTSVASSLSTGGNVRTHTFDVTGSGFTSLSWSRGFHASEDAGMFAIEVDGKLLADPGVSLTSVPSIASEVKANPSAGFSIVKWEGDGQIGRTIAHSLNKTPEFIIAKNLSAAVRWAVYTKTVGPGNSLILNDTTTPTGGTGIWGNVDPTSTVFTVGADSEVNTDGSNYIAYCFSPIEGYSAMGSYLGNGIVDGPCVFTGFRPAWIMIKCSNNATNGHWIVMDTKRDTYNVAYNRLMANKNWEENNSSFGPNTVNSMLDILSNGFKIRTTSTTGINYSGDTYVYFAFAEHPFKSARAR